MKSYCAGGRTDISPLRVHPVCRWSKTSINYYGERFGAVFSQLHRQYGPLVTVDVGLSKIVMLGKHEVAHKMLAERGAKLLISSLISLQDTCYSSAKESASDSHSTSYLLIYIILFTHTLLALMKYWVKLKLTESTVGLRKTLILFSMHMNTMGTWTD